MSFARTALCLAALVCLSAQAARCESQEQEDIQDSIIRYKAAIAANGKNPTNHLNLAKSI